MLISNFDSGKYVIIFGVENSLSAHTNNGENTFWLSMKINEKHWNSIVLQWQQRLNVLLVLLCQKINFVQLITMAVTVLCLLMV